MKILFFVILFTMIQSCDMSKQPPKEFNSEHSRVYRKSIDETWNRINEWIIKKNVDTKVNDKAEGLIHFEIKVPDSLVYKYTDYTRTGYFNNLFSVVGSVYVLVKKIGEYTKVDVLITFGGIHEHQVVWFKGQSTERETVKQNTTGMLEKEILDFISNDKGK